MGPTFVGHVDVDVLDSPTGPLGLVGLISQFTQFTLFIKQLPCIVIPSPNTFKIVETDNSDIGYGGILKQVAKNDTKEQIVRFYSGFWLATQQNHSIIKKEILSIILCVSKFQNDLFNQKFLIRVDCKSAKEVLQKDVQNLVSKKSFARW